MIKKLRDLIEHAQFQNRLGPRRVALLLLMVGENEIHSEGVGEMRVIDQLQANLLTQGNDALRKLRADKSKWRRDVDRPIIQNEAGRKRIEEVRLGNLNECYVWARANEQTRPPVPFWRGGAFGDVAQVLRVASMGDGDVTWTWLGKDEDPGDSVW